jgi:DNA-binding SARP family transcriptional activator/tetratricopeptide (TPR) repeat protein
MVKKASKKNQKQGESFQIKVAVLGVPRLEMGERVIRLPYLKAEALFYYLAVMAQPQSRPALAALLWGKSAENQARNSLRNAIYTIRKQFYPASPLLIERDTICLDFDTIQLDLAFFQTTIQNLRDPAMLAEALACWRGKFLDGLHLPDAPVFEQWLVEQREQVEALYRQGLLHLAQLYFAEKQLTDARQTIEKLLAVDPLHEAGHQLLMRLFVQMGNRAAALRQYETLRTRLVDQLGVDPDPAIQAFHLELLQADDSHPPVTAIINLPREPQGAYPFVGRDHELALLSKAYQQVLPRGPARLVMLQGEPGIGKTRLAREWLASLEAANILTTRCFEAEQAIPFHPWLDLIRTTLRKIPLPQLELSDVWLTELTQLVPEIRLQRPDLELYPAGDPELARGRIIQAMIHWLAALCREIPLCIFIDDWQWLDQASLTLLRYIFHAQQNSQLPLFILGAQRETQPVSGWPQFKAKLAREDFFDAIELHRLSLSDLTAIAKSLEMAPSIQIDRFLQQLWQETEGNPLFVTQFLQTLRQADLQTGEWPIPPTIQSLIQNRLARLAESTYQVMTAAAVMGRTFTDTVLQKISTLSMETVLLALDEAIAANIITEQAGIYDFTHDKIRTVLLDSLTQSRRRHLHASIAVNLETTAPTDFGLLSYHFEMSGDPQRARHYALLAARRSVELYADEDALRWYDKADALTASTDDELDPEDSIPVTPFQQPHVSRGLPLDVTGLIFRQRGLIQQRIGRYDAAEELFLAALKRGQTRNRADEQAAAHNLLSFLAYLRSDYNAVGHHAQLALELADQTGEAALRAPGLRHLGIAVYRTGNYARARQLYDEALEAYRQDNDPLGMATVYNNIGFVLRTQTFFQEAIEAFQEALAIYKATGQTEGVALIYSNIGRTYAFSGDLAQARHYLERGLALSIEAHADWVTAKIHRTLGNVFIQAEQWSLALNHARQAQTLATTLGSDEDLGGALRLIAEIAAAWPQSNLGDPKSYFEQSMALFNQVGAQDELELTETAFAEYMRQHK